MRILFLALIVLSACNNQGFTTTATSDTTTTTHDINDAGEWKDLFDGKTTNGWHSYGQEKAGEAWKVAEGALVLDTTQKEEWQIKGGGDLVSNEEFENYDLKLEWKIAPAGNSGIIFNLKEDTSKYKYTWSTGPEMQVADNDLNEDGKIFEHQAGDLYDLIASSKKAVKKAGEWNEVEIICNKGKLDLYLNKEHIVSTTLWDDNWKKLIAESKFKDMPDFGTFKKGRIALQDHGAMVWYRNIRIKQL